MKRAVGLLALVLGFAMLLPVAAEAQSACSDYRVKRGDTLHKISVRAYGFDNHRRIYSANAQRIGRNPNVIEIGTVLWLPCQNEVSLSDVPSDRTVSFVTASDFAPYVDEAAPGGGVLSELVQMAMRRAGGAEEVEIVFVNDRRAHLAHLLPRGAFDASFPWPECQGEDCPAVLYSNPLFELTEGFFAAADSGLLSVIDADALDGTLVCRPAGMAPAALEATHSAATVEGCFEALANGVVDLVAVDTRTGDLTLEAMGLGGQIVASPHLVSVVPVHVAVSQNAPEAETLIRRINRGVGQMLDSGEWDAITSSGLRRGSGDMTN